MIIEINGTRKNQSRVSQQIILGYM